MPKVFEQIQENEDAAALKAICCDAFSNIGSHIFERLTVSEVTIMSTLCSNSKILASETNGSDIFAIRLYIR